VRQRQEGLALDLTSHNIDTILEAVNILENIFSYNLWPMAVVLFVNK
jgi:hypothetical protein